MSICFAYHIYSIIKISPDNQEQFQNAMMVLTDYLKTYGEVFF